MNNDAMIFKTEERAQINLRVLYSSYGYSQYKMSKFEEYDLYVKNKDFLLSGDMITFTDASGKLMALKPDVTMSIIKNSTEGESLRKVFYTENVYRMPKGSRAFKEIMQVGLECIGEVDEYAVCEVLMLATKSLGCISPSWTMDVSHLGIVSGVLEYAGLGEEKEQILSLLGEKNVGGIKELCAKKGVSEEKVALVEKLATVSGNIKTVGDVVDGFAVNECAKQAVDSLKTLLNEIERTGGANVNVDFSVSSNMKYYNGIVFCGFIDGIPSSILSGGQYDNLMKRMGKSSKAIGFAVQLDLLERFEQSKKKYDFDVLVVTGDASISKINDTVSALKKEGKSVYVSKSASAFVKCESVVTVGKGE